MKFKDKWQVYEAINQHKGMNVANIAGFMNWDIKKATKAVKELLKEGMIEERKEGKWFSYYPTSYRKMLKPFKESLKGSHFP